jgi:hydroxypyruvate isomerase
VPREAQHKSIVEGLKAAHEIVAPYGITMLLEPLNTLVNHQGYYLDHTPETFRNRAFARYRLQTFMR